MKVNIIYLYGCNVVGAYLSLSPSPSSSLLLPLSPHLHSLPPYIVVPYNISDDTLEYVASLHSDNRLPVRLLLSTYTKYFHTKNIFYSFIIRCSLFLYSTGMVLESSSYWCLSHQSLPS